MHSDGSMDAMPVAPSLPMAGQPSVGQMPQAVQSAVDETGNIVVWEDHLMMGGLASSIADFFVDNGIQPRKFRRFGIPQVYAGFGSGEALRQKYGYAKEDVMKAIREMV